MGAAGDRAGDEIAQRFVVLRPELALPIDQAQAGGKALARREPGQGGPGDGRVEVCACLRAIRNGIAIQDQASFEQDARLAAISSL